MLARQIAAAGARVASLPANTVSDPTLEASAPPTPCHPRVRIVSPRRSSSAWARPACWTRRPGSSGTGAWRTG